MIRINVSRCLHSSLNFFLVWKILKVNCCLFFAGVADRRMHCIKWGKNWRKDLTQDQHNKRKNKKNIKKKQRFNAKAPEWTDKEKKTQEVSKIEEYYCSFESPKPTLNNNKRYAYTNMREISGVLFIIIHKPNERNQQLWFHNCIEKYI